MSVKLIMRLSFIRLRINSSLHSFYFHLFIAIRVDYNSYNILYMIFRVNGIYMFFFEIGNLYIYL